MGISFRTLSILLLSLNISCSTAVRAEPPELTLFGWLERVTIYPADILLHAKLDTGADNCSVHAESMEEFEKSGERWVRFTMSNRYGEKEKLQRRVIRTAKVKKKTGGSQKRPVVRLSLCIGSTYETIECNLVDRSHFDYPVLIGRNFLAGSALVNSSETYTTEPSCKPPRTK